MVNKTWILLAVGVSLIVLATSAGAQDEQWLQYHSEREAQQIIGGMSSRRNATSNKPQDVKLPEFKTKQQFFIDWATPMVESGRLWIALDRTSEQGKWDRLFIDSNGNGHLDDEEAVTAYRTEQYFTYFGPVKIVFEGEDGPISYHLNFRFYDYNEQNRRLYIYSGGWYEGEVTVAGEKKYCVLTDYNVNGTFDDKSLQARGSDRIRIGKKGGRDTGFVGNYIEVDDVLYRTEIARDGVYIKLTTADDVKYGNIRVPAAITEFAAGGTAEQRSIRFPENRSIEQTSTDLDAEMVLQRAGVEYDKHPSLLYDCDTVVTWPERKFKPGDRTKLRYVCRVIQDGDRVDGTINVLETVDSNEIPFKESRQIWDGSRFLLRTKLPSMDHHNAYFSQDKTLRAILLQTELKDSFLDGIGISGCIGDHYAKVLPGTAKLTLRKQMEDVSGHACYVVEAVCSEGENCTFWIDPAAGYHLRKVVIRYRLIEDPPQPTAGKIVPGTIQNSEFIIDDVILGQVSGIWLPIAGTYEQRWTYLDGRSHHSKRKVSRYNIVWNPDLEALRAFKIDLPEGARIRNHDDESNDYVWRNGRPEKVNHIHAEMVGRQAPLLEVEKCYNSQAGGLDRKGKVILLDFFGVWCRPCMAKIPFFKGLHEHYSDRGLIIICVHTAQSSEKIPEFISRDDIKYTIAVDEHGINAKSFNVFFYPTIVLIDRKGIIKAVNPSETELKDLLKLLLE